MADTIYRTVAEKRVAIVHAVAELTQALGTPPTPRQVSEATHIPPATLSRQIAALVASGELGRVYGGRGLVVKVTTIDDLAISRAASPLLPRERAVLDAVAQLHKTAGGASPVPLASIIGHIVAHESTQVERLIRKLVATGYLIAHDDGYVPAHDEVPL